MLSGTESGSVTRIDLRHWELFCWNYLQPRKVTKTRLLHPSPTTKPDELVQLRGMTFTDTNKLGPQYMRRVDHAIFPDSLTASNTPQTEMLKTPAYKELTTAVICQRQSI